MTFWNFRVYVVGVLKFYIYMETCENLNFCTNPSEGEV